MQLQMNMKHFLNYGRKSLRNIGICLGHPVATGKEYPIFKKITLAYCHDLHESASAVDDNGELA